MGQNGKPSETLKKNILSFKKYPQAQSSNNQI